MRRGFSLIEIMAVLSLFLIMMGMTILSLRGGAQGGSAGVRGLAQTLAGELKAARQKAIETRSPVAIAIPSAGGTRPHSQAAYQLEGLPHPKVTRVMNTAGEFPGAYLAVGVWPGATATIDSPRQAPPHSFYLPGWPDPPTKDYLLTFDNEGNLCTNDLPWVNGRVYVVACAGLDFAAAAAPGGTARAAACTPGYFQLTQVYQPYSVSLDPSGTVFVEPGLPGASAGVVSGAGSSEPNVPPAAPPSLTFSANTNPEIREIQVLPVGNSAVGAFNTSVPTNGYATLVVRAADADGDKLSCAWTCSAGAMSHLPGGGQLTWDPRENVWKSVWIWTPPVTATDESTFTLNCTVVDDRGGTVTASGASGLTMQVRNAGKVAFAGPDVKAGSTGGEIFTCNPDGTGARRVTNNTVDDKQPSLSPDGTKIVFSSQLNSDPGAPIYNLFVMNVDGTGLRQLTSSTTLNHEQPTFNPDGTLIAFTRSDGKVCVLNPDGSIEEKAEGGQPAWNPTVGNQSLTYSSAGNVFVHVETPTPANVALTSGTPAAGNPSWTLDGRFVLFTDTTGALTAVNASDPADKRSKGSAQGSTGPLRYATTPGSPQLVFPTLSGIKRADDAGPAVPLFNVKSITPYGVGGVDSPSWAP